jgi:hypothetical protein
MKPESSDERLLLYLEKSRFKLSSLGPEAGISSMLNWYSEERAEGCPLDQDQNN